MTIESVCVEMPNGEVCILPNEDGKVQIPFTDRAVIAEDDSVLVRIEGDTVFLKVVPQFKGALIETCTGEWEEATMRGDGILEVPYHALRIRSGDHAKVETDGCDVTVHTVPRRILLGAGEKVNFGSVRVCTAAGHEFAVGEGGNLPPDMVGKVVQDEASGCSYYIPEKQEIPPVDIRDKNGDLIEGEIRVLRIVDFTELPRSAQDGDRLMVVDDCGKCRLVGLPEIPDVVVPPAVDPCEVLAARPTVACEAATNVLVDGCNWTDIKSFLPRSSFDECVGQPEELSGGTAVQGVQELSAQRILPFLDGGWVWDRAIAPVAPDDPRGMTRADYPRTIQIPAHDPDTVLAFHLTYGAQDARNGESQIRSVSLDYSNGPLVLVDDNVLDSVIGDMGSYVWFFDTDGSAGTLTMDLVFQGDRDPFIGSVLMAVSTIADTSGAPLRISQALVGDAVHNLSQPIPQASATYPDFNPTGNPSEPIDMGECPAVRFAMGRHVDFDTDVGWVHNPGIGTDVSWYANTVGDITYNMSSDNDAQACQGGIAMAVIPPNAGSHTWTYTPNVIYEPEDWNQPHSTRGLAVTIPFDCSSTSAGNATSTVCSGTVTNDNCLCSAVCRFVVSARGSINATAGEETKLVPILNGVRLEDYAVVLPASFSGEYPFRLNAEYMDMNAIPPKGSRTAAMQFEVSGGTARLDAQRWTSEAIPQ